MAPLLPEIAAHFASVPNISLLSRLVLTSPAVTTVLAAPLIGWAIDVKGRKQIYTFSVLVFTIGGLAGYFLDSIYAIIVSRLVLGLGIAGVLTTTTSLIGDYYHSDDRIRMMGYQAATMAAGGMVFLIAAGTLGDVHWRLPFLFYGFGLAVLLLIVLFIREPDRSHLHKDSGSLKDLKPCWNIYMVCIFYVAVFYMMPVVLPFHMKELLGVSNAVVGATLALSTLFSTTAGALYATVRKRLDIQTLFVGLFAIVGAGFWLMSVATSLVTLAVGISITGLGAGFAFPNLNMWVTDKAPDEVRGRAVGLLSMSLFFGSFLSAFLAEPLVSIGGNSMALAIGGTATLILSALFLFQYTRRSKQPA